MRFLRNISSRAMSAKNHTFTLGIEEEFAIVDPETRELRSHIQEILEGGKVMLKEQIKPEMHQSVVELGTEICDSIEHARAHVVDLAQQTGRAGRRKRIENRLGRHASVFALARSAHHRGRALQAKSSKTCSCSRARI